MAEPKHVWYFVNARIRYVLPGFELMTYEAAEKANERVARSIGPWCKYVLDPEKAFDEYAEPKAE